jgi:methyl-accepting chemotaxis protein
MTDMSVLKVHDDRVLAYKARFVFMANVATGAVLVAALVVLVLLADYHPGEVAVVSAGLAIACVGALAARVRSMIQVAVSAYLTLPLLAMLFACFSREYMVTAFLYTALLYVPTPFISRPRTPLVLFAVQLLLIPALLLLQTRLGFRPWTGVAIHVGISYLVIGAIALVLWILSREILHSEGMLRSKIEEIEVVSAHASRISEGDLAVEIQETGFWADAFREMIHKVQEVIQSIARTSLEINAASEQIYAACQHQQKGATEQSSAVAEIRQTMEGLVKSSMEISIAAKAVTQNADTTLHNNEGIEKRIHLLSERTKRIKEILEVIQDISNKSDLLALNASLEGTRAGEAGRGFTLVAGQMQRLAEKVMAAVKDIKGLTADIFSATNSSVLATEEGTKMASQTATSAQQINLITQQQQSATEQVWRAIDDILTISKQSVASSEQTLASTQDLTQLSEQLQQLVATFKVVQSEPSG